MATDPDLILPRDAPTATVPTTGAPVLPGDAIGAWINQVKNFAVYQQIERWQNPFIDDPDFNPIENIEGYEGYARDLVDARSQAELDFLIERIDRSNDARALAQQELGFLGQLSTELLNPINLIPIPFLSGARGLGLARGALRGSAGTATVLAAEEGLRHYNDPTATLEETIATVGFGSILGGGIGGVLGSTGSRGLRTIARVDRLERDFNAGRIDQEQFVNAMMDITDVGRAPGYRVEPTTGETGIARAFGLENQTRITAFGQLMNRGVQAVDDFANTMLGDFNVMNQANMSGRATAQSIKLNVDSLWKGRSMGVIQDLSDIYGRMLRDGAPRRQALGIDPDTAVARVRQAVSRDSRPEGKARFDEYKREVFEAYLRGRSDDPYVKEGMARVGEFFDFARERMETNGTLPTKKSQQARRDRKISAIRQAQADLRRARNSTERTALERKLTNAVAALSRMNDQALIRAGFGDIVKAAKKAMAAENRYTGNPLRDRIAMDRSMLDDLNARRDFLTPDEAQLRADLEEALDGASPANAAQGSGGFARINRQLVLTSAKKTLRNISRNSENPAHRALARKLFQAIDDDVEITIADRSDDMGSEFKNAHGLSDFRQGKSRILLNAELEGLSENVILHEAIHVALHKRVIGNLENTAANPGAKELDAAIKDLKDLQIAAQDAATPMQAGKWGLDRRPLMNLDEFIAWGMTDPDFRAFLKSVPAKSSDDFNGWQKFVNAVMRVLGLEPRFKSSVENILEVRTLGDEVTEKTYELLSMPEKSGKTADVADSAAPEPKRYLDALDERIAKYEGGFDAKRFGGENYLPRFWLIDKIMADEAGPKVLRRKLEQHYARGGVVTDEVRARVNESIETITQQSELGELQMFAPNRGVNASFMRERQIDIPNSEVLDFIETDFQRILNSYAERAGTIDEINRIFGDPDAQGAIDDILVQSAREGIEGANWLKLADDLEWARDKRTEAIYEMEPHLVSKRRIASALRSYGAVAYLGKAALSAIPEIGRTLMAHGFARTFDAIARQAFKNPAFANTWEQLPRLTGKGLDSLAGTSMARFVEQGGPTGAAASGIGRGVQRGVDFASGPAFIVNLLSPMTDMTKRMSQTFTHQFMLEDVVKIAEGKATRRVRERMASYGIDEDMAERIANQPFEDANGWFMPNMREWPDAEAARTFLSAVSGMTDNIIPTAGLSDIPEVAKGFVKGREYPLLVLPFQFMSYGFAVANRVLLSGLQGRDADAMMGIAALIGLGYLSQSIKTDENHWNSMTPTERAIRSVDAAGITGIYSDLNTAVETITSDTLGVRPLLGARPFLGNQDAFEAAGGFGGPTGDMIVDLMKLAGDDEMSSQEQASTVRGLLPWNTLFYTDALFDGAQKQMASAWSDAR